MYVEWNVRLNCHEKFGVCVCVWGGGGAWELKKFHQPSPTVTQNLNFHIQEHTYTSHSDISQFEFITVGHISFTETSDENKALLLFSDSILVLWSYL